MPRPALEVSQIFRHHGQAYRENHRLSPEQHKAMGDIERCRTAHLGGHVDVCRNGCGYFSLSDNSCRNRHGPKCQSLQPARWLEARLERLLPTRSFHPVVTLPHELNPVARFNRELVFNLLFEAASRALRKCARDYERLRAQVGFTAVLHTWDQELNSHHHPHLVVTGGGLSEDGERWIAAGNSFLLPVRALSKIVRAKFMEALEQAFREGRLQGKVQDLEGPVQFQRFSRKLKQKSGSSMPKSCSAAPKRPTITSNEKSRYTHRVAISNHRLVSLAEGKVSFRARDNNRPGQKRLVTTTAQEFIRRFLRHVLPPRFVKIRHYGLMAPCNAKTKLEKARALISLQAPLTNDEPKGQELDTSKEAKTWREMMQTLTGLDLTPCPPCGTGNLIRFQLTASEQPLLPPIGDSS